MPYRPTDLFFLKGFENVLILSMIIIFLLSIPSRVILVVLGLRKAYLRTKVELLFAYVIVVER